MWLHGYDVTELVSWRSRYAGIGIVALEPDQEQSREGRPSAWDAYDT